MNLPVLSHPLRAFGLLLLPLALAGCVFPLPAGEYGRENIGDAVPPAIVVGKTTREDVLLSLGEPDGESNAQRRFLYYRVSGRGGVGFVFVAGTGGMLATSERDTYHRLLIEFDSAGVVSGARFTNDTCDSGTFGVGWSSSESPPCVDVSPHGPLPENPAIAADSGAVVFTGIGWLAGVDAVHGLGLIERMSKGLPRDGTLVFGSKQLLFFPAGADSVSRPDGSWIYAEIREQRVERDGKHSWLLLHSVDGHVDSIRAVDAATIAAISAELADRMASAGRADAMP